LDQNSDDLGNWTSETYGTESFRPSEYYEIAKILELFAEVLRKCKIATSVNPPTFELICIFKDIPNKLQSELDLIEILDDAFIQFSQKIKTLKVKNL